MPCESPICLRPFIIATSLALFVPTTSYAATPSAATPSAAKPPAKDTAAKSPTKPTATSRRRRRRHKRKGPAFRIARSRWEETDKLPAVQNRQYRLQHEFAFGGSHVPLDPFTKAFALTGGYTWHVNHAWGIESRFAWLFNYRAKLRDDLENNFGEPPSKFRRMNWYALLGTLFKPFYGKFAFFNNRQAYGEFYLSIYAALAQLDGGEKTENEPAGRGERFALGPAPGFGIRGFITHELSVRFDFNWMILFTGGFLAKNDSPFEVDAPLTLTFTLAYSLNFGSDE